MNVEEWFYKNKFKCDSFRDLKRLVKLKKQQKTKISLCIPTLNEEKTIGFVIDMLKPELYDKNKLLDEIVVVDSGSTDNTKEEVEKRVKDWNANQEDSLKEGYIIAQLNWHKVNPKKVPPPNYSNKAYYADIGIEPEENILRMFKNPVTQTVRRFKLSKKKIKKKKKQKKKDSKPL